MKIRHVCYQGTTQKSRVPDQMPVFLSTQMQPSPFLPLMPTTVGSYRGPEWSASSQMTYTSMTMPSHFLNRSETLNDGVQFQHVVSILFSWIDRGCKSTEYRDQSTESFASECLSVKVATKDKSVKMLKMWCAIRNPSH